MKASTEVMLCIRIITSYNRRKHQNFMRLFVLLEYHVYELYFNNSAAWKSCILRRRRKAVIAARNRAKF